MFGFALRRVVRFASEISRRDRQSALRVKGLPQDLAVPQGQAELFEVGFRQFRQKRAVDVMIGEDFRILTKTVLSQPFTNVVDCIRQLRGPALPAGSDKHFVTAKALGQSPVAMPPRWNTITRNIDFADVNSFV